MKKLATLIIGLLTAYSVNAQNIYTLNTENSSVIIKGTSSLHDWESNAESFGSDFTPVFAEDGSLKGISNLTFYVDVESIKSGKGIMDGKTHSALEQKKHPQITFKLIEITSITEDSLFANGTLSIAGKENKVELATAYSGKNTDNIRVQGSKSLLMTDFGIKPPKAMLGTLKTGDEVTIQFDVIYQKK